MPHTGACLCGSLRYAITAPPIDAGYCHCRLCQRSAGAPVLALLLDAGAGLRAPFVQRASAATAMIFASSALRRAWSSKCAIAVRRSLPPLSKPAPSVARGVS